MNGEYSAREVESRSIGGLFRRRGLALLLAVLAWGVTSAIAADDNKVIYPSGASRGPAPSAAATSSTLNSITLVVAFVMAGAGAWLFLRNRRTQGISAQGRLLSVDETRSLGNRQYLVVASYEDKKFLLGVCPGRIDLLAPLSDPKPEEKRP